MIDTLQDKVGEFFYYGDVLMRLVAYNPNPTIILQVIGSHSDNVHLSTTDLRAMKNLKALGKAESAGIDAYQKQMRKNAGRGG